MTETRFKAKKLRHPDALLHIQETPAGPAAQPSLRAFLEMAFRPLYLAACAWSLLAVALWIFAPHLLRGELSGIAWHAHEMLWGFIATIAWAFLLTAGANWTGINPMQGRLLALSCALWLIARVAFLLPGQTALWLASAAEMSFFLLGAAAMLHAVIRAKNFKNIAVPLVLAGLGLAAGAYVSARADFVMLMQRFDVGLLLMALLALLIGRRVIPYFTMNAIKGLNIPRHTRSGQLQLAGVALALVCLWLGWSSSLALALGATALLALWQLLCWQPLAARHQPLVWILHLGYAGLGLGLLLVALRASGLDMPNALPVHMLAMSGFSLLIIGMVTRTALGHLGRPLACDRSMLGSYLLLLLALLLRLAAIIPWAPSTMLLHSSATAWMAAMALYVWRFAPLMIRPRLH